MKFVWTAAAAAGALVISAIPSFSADLGGRLPTKAPPMVAPLYNWTGLYIGGHVGYGWSEANTRSVEANPTYPAGFAFPTTNMDGVLGGGQVGFNYQFQQWVIGVEGDISATDFHSDTRAFSPNVLPPIGRYTDIHSNIDWLATVTGRLGYAADNWLFYVKGGGAWADVNGTSETYTPGGVLIATSSFSNSRSGWTVGGGAEYGFASNWSAKLEYNYIDFGNYSFAVTSVNTPGFGGATSTPSRDGDGTMHLVKVGLNYRLGGLFGGSTRY